MMGSSKHWVEGLQFALEAVGLVIEVFVGFLYRGKRMLDVYFFCVGVVSK